jgi:hypothetical protein
VAKAIEESMAYLRTKMADKAVYDDPYVLAIVTYALALNDDPLLDSTFEKLSSMAISKGR